MSERAKHTAEQLARAKRIADDLLGNVVEVNGVGFTLEECGLTLDRQQVDVTSHNSAIPQFVVGPVTARLSFRLSPHDARTEMVLEALHRITKIKVRYMGFEYDGVVDKVLSIGATR